MDQRGEDGSCDVMRFFVSKIRDAVWTGRGVGEVFPKGVDMVLCAAERCDAVGVSSSMCYSGCMSGSGASYDAAVDIFGCVLAAKSRNADCDLSALPDRTPDCLLNECLDYWGECLSN